MINNEPPPTILLSSIFVSNYFFLSNPIITTLCEIKGPTHSSWAIRVHPINIYSFGVNYNTI